MSDSEKTADAKRSDEITVFLRVRLTSGLATRARSVSLANSNSGQNIGLQILQVLSLKNIKHK